MPTEKLAFRGREVDVVLVHDGEEGLVFFLGTSLHGAVCVCHHDGQVARGVDWNGHLSSARIVGDASDDNPVALDDRVFSCVYLSKGDRTGEALTRFWDVQSWEFQCPEHAVVIFDRPGYKALSFCYKVRSNASKAGVSWLLEWPNEIFAARGYADGGPRVPDDGNLFFLILSKETLDEGRGETLKLFKSTSCLVVLDHSNINEDFLQVLNLLVSELADVANSVAAERACNGSVIQVLGVYSSSDALLSPLGVSGVAFGTVSVPNGHAAFPRAASSWATMAGSAKLENTPSVAPGVVCSGYR